MPRPAKLVKKLARKNRLVPVKVSRGKIVLRVRLVRQVLLIKLQHSNQVRNKTLLNLRPTLMSMQLPQLRVTFLALPAPIAVKMALSTSRQLQMELALSVNPMATSNVNSATTTKMASPLPSLINTVGITMLYQQSWQHQAEPKPPANGMTATATA